MFALRKSSNSTAKLPADPTCPLCPLRYSGGGLIIARENPKANTPGIEHEVVRRASTGADNPFPRGRPPPRIAKFRVQIIGPPMKNLTKSMPFTQSQLMKLSEACSAVLPRTCQGIFPEQSLRRSTISLPIPFFFCSLMNPYPVTNALLSGKHLLPVEIISDLVRARLRLRPGTGAGRKHRRQLRIFRAHVPRIGGRTSLGKRPKPIRRRYIQSAI